MSYDNDEYCTPYNSPEKHGLRIVEATWMQNLSYEFSATILWEEVETGVRWFASHSGCSCPMPFENVKDTDDMTPYKGHEQEYRNCVAYQKAGRSY